MDSSPVCDQKAIELNGLPVSTPVRPGIFSRSQWLLAAAGFDLLVLVLMSGLLAYLVNVTDGRVRWLHPSMGGPLVILLGVLLINSIRNFYLKNSQKKAEVGIFDHGFLLFRCWMPFFLVDFIYENLHSLSAKISSFDLAPWLYQMDLKLFGFEPTVAVQAITAPWLTDLMAILYAPYLIYPMVLMAILSLGHRRLEFQQVSLAVILTFLLGFLCYVVFPALPPRFYIPEMFTHPVHLSGSYIHDRLQNVWDELSAVKGAAFPSLHVALSSIALYYAFQFRKISRWYRILFYVYLPLVPGLWFSTIYLRHHWVLDIVAAWGICAAAILFSTQLNQLTWRLRSKYEISQ